MTSKRGKKFQTDDVFKWLSGQISGIYSCHHIHPATYHLMRGNTSQRSNLCSPSCYFLCDITFSKGTSSQCCAKISLTPISDLLTVELTIPKPRQQGRESNSRSLVELSDTPGHCVCGSPFNPDHAMICRHYSLTFVHYNEVRDLTADWLAGSLS